MYQAGLKTASTKMLRLTDSEKAMLMAATARRRRRWSCWFATPRWAPSVSSTREMWRACRARPTIPAAYAGKDADGLDAIFSYFDLDSDELVDVPDALVPTFHLQGGADLATGRRSA